MSNVLIVIWLNITIAIAAILIPMAEQEIELPTWAGIAFIFWFVGGLFGICFFSFWEEEKNKKALEEGEK